MASPRTTLFLVLLVGSAHAARRLQEEPDAIETMIALAPGEEAEQRQGEGSEIFVVESITLEDLMGDSDDDDGDGTPDEGGNAGETEPDEGGDAGETEPQEGGGAAAAEAPMPRDGGKTSFIIEMRSKIRFKGNKIGLRNPQMVPALVRDINNLKKEHAESKFVYCLHVGTTAGEKLKAKRPGFMEGRVKTLADALEAEDDELKVGSNAFEHYESTRFAGARAGYQQLEEGTCGVKVRLLSARRHHCWG